MTALSRAEPRYYGFGKNTPAKRTGRASHYCDERQPVTSAFGGPGGFTLGTVSGIQTFLDASLPEFGKVALSVSSLFRALAHMRQQLPLAQTDVQRRHFHQLIVLDIGHGLFQGHRHDGRQTHRLIL